jgi:uncharacterized protein DUF3738
VFTVVENIHDRCRRLSSRQFAGLSAGLMWLAAAELHTSAAGQEQGTGVRGRVGEAECLRRRALGELRRARRTLSGGERNGADADQNGIGVHDDQAADGPDWINSARFDLTAKAAGTDSPPSATAFRDRARLMLRRALADRFNLVAQLSSGRDRLVLDRTDSADSTGTCGGARSH